MKFDHPQFIYELPTINERESRHGAGVKYAQIGFRIALKIYYRTMLSEAQNHRCCWCGIRMVTGGQLSNSATIEHIEPKSKGGEDHPDNYAIACSKCNTKRGTKDIEVFKRELEVLKEYRFPIKPRKRNPSKERMDLQVQLKALGGSFSRKHSVAKLQLKLVQIEARISVESGIPNNFPAGSAGYKHYNYLAIKHASRLSLI